MPASSATPSEIDPTTAATLRRMLVVDVRPEEERLALGWIPGSRHQPVIDPARAARDEPSMFMCHSGARSALVVHQIRSQGGRALNLTGGLRAWRDAGLPLCDPMRASLPPEDRGPLTLLQLVRMVRSCFVVESVVTHVGDEDDPNTSSTDAVAEFERRFAPNILPLSRREYERRLDGLAEGAWRNDHRLDAIARNIERFYALGRNVSWST